MVSAADLRDYVGAHEGTDANFLAACWEEAAGLVDTFIGEPDVFGPNWVPGEARHRAILEVGSELYHRKNAPNGLAQFASVDGSPMRVARDPMVGAYPILRRFLPGGFA